MGGKKNHITQQPTRNFSDKFFLVLKGVAMGTANKVPGVSGGIVAYVAGFYEEFIYSLQRFNLKSFKLLVAGKFKSFYQYTNGKFLSLLLLGEAISYFTVSKGFDMILQHYPIIVWAAFFGMIVGSVYYIARSYDDWNRKNIIILISGAVIGVGISLLDPATENQNLFFVFFCGVISISGMTLPGLSGSFLLILLGNYVLLMVDSINAFFDAMVASAQLDFSWLNDPVQMNLLTILAVFLAGSIFGLVSLSHLLGWTMKFYKNETNALLLGFIVGSLGTVWPWKKEIFTTDETGAYILDNNGSKILENYSRYIPDINDWHTWMAIIWMVIGFLIVYLIDHYGSRKDPA